MATTDVKTILRSTKIKSVLSAVVCQATVTNSTYDTELNFNEDQYIYKDATGLSPTFTLGSNNANGIGIILSLNKPTAVTFPADFEADANSATLDATKLNVYTLVYFSSWDGAGTAHVIYSNSLYTAI